MNTVEKKERPVRRLGVMAECISGKPGIETLDIIREVGFDCYFTGNTDPKQVEALVKRGNELSMPCEFIHAPFKNINDMWLSGMDYLPIFNAMKRSIDVAYDNDLPSVTIHVSSGWKAPQVNDLGLARYDALVEYAIKKNVKLAFENLRKVGNLACLVDRYADIEQVGFCYDCGHEHCYTKTVCWPDIFCKKIIETHIHDNFGRGDDPMGDPDIHLLPFDGDLDYAKMMSKLDEYGYEGALTLEISNRKRPDYAEMTPRQFLETAYERLVRISKM